ncbi:MAG: hypothetical protein AB1489_02460 [Acidobacteriota bacterium]
MNRKQAIFSLIITFLLLLATFQVSLGQGSYGTGKLPNTPPKSRRTLKTIVVVESINAEELTFKGTDEITGDKNTYRASKRTTVVADKGLLGLFGKKELQFTDLQKGQRIEIKYNENLPTSVVEIKVLKTKDAD